MTLEISEELDAAWAELINEPWNKPGRYERRVAYDAVHILYAVLIRPTAAIGLALVVPSKIALAIAEDSAKGFILAKDWKEGSDKVILTLTVTEHRYRELFKVLASDVLSRILREKLPEQGALAMVARLSHWKRFLRAAKEQGLPLEEQIGLFGELYVIRSMIQTNRASPTAVISAWHGPAGANQDFQHLNRALEIKSTLSNDIARIRIANERQLDEQGLAQLILVQLAFDAYQGTSLTLPSIVCEIEALLPEEVRDTYFDLLASVGYHSIHKSMYEERGYSLRASRCFDVSDPFPRIRASDLRSGVSEVRYLADVSNICPVFDDLSRLVEVLFPES